MKVIILRTILYCFPPLFVYCTKLYNLLGYMLRRLCLVGDEQGSAVQISAAETVKYYRFSASIIHLESRINKQERYREEVHLC
jgi:hypothetical protein